MRSLEVLLVVLLGVGVLLLCRRARNRILLGWLVVAELIVLLLHLAFEWPHWQMIPAYVAALVLPLAVPHIQWVRRTGAALVLLLLIATLGASWVVPMFRLPRATGKFGIGTRIYEIANPHPADPRSAGPDGKRPLVFQVWYPAIKHRGFHADYRRWSETEPRSTYQAVLRTHSRWNGPYAPAAGKMPVLLLNPAWTGRRTFYTYLTEDLASHGYFVVGIDHTGDSGPTLFADGHMDKPGANPGSDPEGLEFSKRTLAQLDAYTSEQMAIETEDDRFILDTLTAWNADPSNPFFQKLDLTRVGALGHSFGGAVAVEATRTDPRVKAALDFDGSFWGRQATEGTDKPLMMIEEDPDKPSAEELKNLAVYNNHQLDLRDATMVAKSHGIHIYLHGSTHSSFTDQNLFSHLARYSGVGTIPAKREYLILRQLTLAFFDKTLRGQDSPLLKGQPHPFPEVTYEQK